MKYKQKKVTFVKGKQESLQIKNEVQYNIQFMAHNYYPFIQYIIVKICNGFVYICFHWRNLPNSNQTCSTLISDPYN